jgi:hypothetical protein
VRDTSLSTADVVQRYIMPQTSQLKCRYCDLISEKLHDSPTFYVVHCWQCNFVSMVESVRQYVYQLRTNLDDVFIWLDILCINQHGERTGSDVLQVKDVINVGGMMQGACHMFFNVLCMCAPTPESSTVDHPSLARFPACRPQTACLWCLTAMV